MDIQKHNIFIAFTPFHHYVINNIINQYFSNDYNCFISTVKGDLIPNKHIFYIRIRRNMLGIFDMLKAKKIIKKYIMINTTEIFIPHLNQLLTSYIYDLRNKYLFKISVYYEGIAIFYEIKKKYLERTIIRKLAGIILGYNFKPFPYLFTEELKRTAIVYTPIPECTIPFMEKRKISLNSFNIKYALNSLNNILIILPPSINKEYYLKRKYESITKILFNKKYNNYIFYIKPHYNTIRKDYQRVFAELSQNLGYNRVRSLSPEITVEEFILTGKFSVIISQYFSSALINAKLIFNEIEVILLEENTIADLNCIIKKINIFT